MTSDEWRDHAACRGTDERIWFPDAEDSRIAYRQARAICDTCGVRAECLADAVATDELYHGFRGGMRPKERQQYVRFQQRTWHEAITVIMQAERP
jgi:WhiB family transcriptional regulator, redox-sensing transcriptional regulator